MSGAQIVASNAATPDAFALVKAAGGAACAARSCVLVVDDENGPRQSLRMLLKELYDIRLASGVDAAYRILDEEPVELVITDIRMPGGSGLDLLRRVRQTHPEVQVILLTGYGQLDTAMEAIEFGACAYLEKPFDNNVLLEKVDAALEKGRAERERRAMERLALQANRFETVGRLVSGTMHDLGSPLSVIGSHLDLVLSERMPEAAQRRLETMRQQVQHCNELVRSTMNFLRQSPDSRTLFTLNAVVSSCLDVARPLLGRGRTELSVELEPELAPCLGELVLVRQAILNLVTNSCQAMHRQGPPRRITIRTWEARPWVSVSVEDTGPGIADADAQRIFDTLFTTKAEQGTGLGLAVVRHVMERHGGTVHVETPSSGGARFVLRFPASTL